MKKQQRRRSVHRFTPRQDQTIIEVFNTISLSKEEITQQLNQKLLLNIDYNQYYQRWIRYLKQKSTKSFSQKDLHQILIFMKQDPKFWKKHTKIEFQISLYDLTIVLRKVFFRILRQIQEKSCELLKINEPPMTNLSATQTVRDVLKFQSQKSTIAEQLRYRMIDIILSQFNHQNTSNLNYLRPYSTLKKLQQEKGFQNFPKTKKQVHKWNQTEQKQLIKFIVHFQGYQVKKHQNSQSIKVLKSIKKHLSQVFGENKKYSYKSLRRKIQSLIIQQLKHFIEMLKYQTGEKLSLQVLRKCFLFKLECQLIFNSLIKQILSLKLRSIVQQYEILQIYQGIRAKINDCKVEIKNQFEETTNVEDNRMD